MKMRPFGRLLSAETARLRLLRAVRPIHRTETVALASATGRVSARTYRAPFAVPSFPRATWDGYAFRSRDTLVASKRHPVRFRIVGEVFAEGAFARKLRPGEAVAIATGGAVPAGADTVIIFEQTQVHRGELVVSRRVHPGERVAAPGEDFPKGFRLVGRGELLTPASIGGLAAVGVTSVEVFARPLVTIIPNGNELLSPGGRRAVGRIYETNNLTLGALVESNGGTASGRAPVPDQPAQIERAIRKALRESDLVLVTGGSSVGERDYLPAVFPRLGRLLFHGIAVRPGKPTLAVVAGGTLVVGMPGHPTSCLCNGFWLLLPVLRKLARLPGPGWVDGWVRMDESYEVPTAGLSTVVPLLVENGRARPTFHDSSAITSLAGANAFAFLPPGQSRLGLGARVPVHHLFPPVASRATA